MRNTEVYRRSHKALSPPRELCSHGPPPASRNTQGAPFFPGLHRKGLGPVLGCAAAKQTKSRRLHSQYAHMYCVYLIHVILPSIHIYICTHQHTCIHTQVRGSVSAKAQASLSKEKALAAMSRMPSASTRRSTAFSITCNGSNAHVADYKAEWGMLPDLDCSCASWSASSVLASSRAN